MLWEHDAKVVVDFTGGSGTMTKSALVMGVKVIVVFNNVAKWEFAKAHLTTWMADTLPLATCPSHLKPANYEATMQGLKHHRLVAYETKQLTETTLKRPAAGEVANDKKRQARGSDFDVIIGGVTPKRPATESAVVPKTPPPKATTASPAAAAASINDLGG